MAEHSRGQSKSGKPNSKASEDRTSANNRISANSDHQDASATGGGTTGMDNDASGGSGRSESRAGSGSGITTKRNVTGSDFDGQISE